MTAGAVVDDVVTLGGVRRCEYGLCREPAAYVIVPENAAGDVDGMAVCGLHVTPAVSWGIADPGMPAILPVPTGGGPVSVPVPRSGLE